MFILFIIAKFLTVVISRIWKSRWYIFEPEKVEKKVLIPFSICHFGTSFSRFSKVKLLIGKYLSSQYKGTGRKISLFITLSILRTKRMQTRHGFYICSYISLEHCPNSNLCDRLIQKQSIFTEKRDLSACVLLSCMLISACSLSPIVSFGFFLV